MIVCLDSYSCFKLDPLRLFQRTFHKYLQRNINKCVLNNMTDIGRLQYIDQCKMNIVDTQKMSDIGLSTWGMIISMWSCIMNTTHVVMQSCRMATF